MPIYGGSLEEVARTFQRHLNALFNKTITRTPIRPWFAQGDVDGEIKQVTVFGFQRPGGGAGSAELRTRYGPMQLYIGQTCDTVQEPGQSQLRLRTIAYAYSLQPVAMSDRIVRWEYVRYPGEGSRWSRHHVQGPITFDILDDRDQTWPVDLNDWHLPTGWVPIEEVVRFCLHDLGARALSEPEEWHQALIESYEAFWTRFAQFGEV